MLKIKNGEDEHGHFKGNLCVLKDNISLLIVTSNLKNVQKGPINDYKFSLSTVL